MCVCMCVCMYMYVVGVKHVVETMKDAGTLCVFVYVYVCVGVCGWREHVIEAMMSTGTFVCS